MKRLVATESLSAGGDRSVEARGVGGGGGARERARKKASADPRAPPARSTAPGPPKTTPPIAQTQPHSFPNFPLEVQLQRLRTHSIFGIASIFQGESTFGATSPMTLPNVFPGTLTSPQKWDRLVRKKTFYDTPTACDRLKIRSFVDKIVFSVDFAFSTSDIAAWRVTWPQLWRLIGR